MPVKSLQELRSQRNGDSISLSNQTTLIISLILPLARVLRAYNLGNNKDHQFPKRTYILALPPLALIIAMTVLKNEPPLLRGLLALPFRDLYIFIILNYYKTILIILSMAQLKNIIIIITTRMVRMLQTKVRLKTTTIEAIT